MKCSIVALMRPRQTDRDLAAHAAGVCAQHDDPIGQENRFLDVVGDDQDALGRERPGVPEIVDFAAKILGGEHVERAERFVQKEHFGLDHERARETDALLHPAGKLSGVGALKPVEPDEVDRLAARASSVRSVPTLRASSPSSTFSITVSHGSSAND